VLGGLLGFCVFMAWGSMWISWFFFLSFFLFTVCDKYYRGGFGCYYVYGIEFNISEMIVIDYFVGDIGIRVENWCWPQ
jgi:hypothetical protein